MRYKLNKTVFLPALIFLALVQVGYARGSVNVPVDHPVYRYLDRMWTLGVLAKNLSSSRPLARVEVARRLAEVEKASGSRGGELTRADQDELEWFRMEFAYELAAIGADPGRNRERNLYRWEKGKDHLVADLIFWGRVVNGDRSETDLNFMQRTVGATIRGGLKGKLFYSVAFKEGQVRAKDNPVKQGDAGVKGEYKISGSGSSYIIGDASLVYSASWLDLQLGKENLSWGPGYRGNVCLSDNPASFTFLKAGVEYGPVRFISLQGALQTEVKKETYRTDDSLFVRTVKAAKWIAAHRLEITPHPVVQIGLNETVIYGERGLEPSYLNPLMFYWPAQRDLGDQDNLLMSADVLLRPTDGLRLYGSLLLDELYLGGMFSGNARNKTAFLAGFHLCPPVDPLRNVELRGEYARIQPGVYTHKYPINTYDTWALPLGYWTGENSDDLYLEARYRPSRMVSVSLSTYKTRRGERTPQPFAQDPDPERYPFLHGTVESITGFGGQISCQPIHNVIVSLGINRNNYDNYRNEENKSAGESQASLQLFVKY
jgi:hypothetical protein